ncbi:hypothetical protein D3C83_01940 [compost metagenome]
MGAGAAANDALLAGAIINPRVLNPARPNGRLQRRQRIILDRMGGISPPAAAPAPPIDTDAGMPEEFRGEIPSHELPAPSDQQVPPPTPVPDDEAEPAFPLPHDPAELPQVPLPPPPEEPAPVDPAP